jgi:predicted dehydrogenase
MRSMTRIGIIGTGWGARVQVPAFRAAGLEVAAIAGHDVEKTRNTARDLKLRPFDNWQDLVGSDVDLITIVTPPSTHREMATMALRAGKHVLSEKPTAMNASEVEEMLRAAAEHPNQLALIDHELRFVPTWIEAKRLISGMGDVRYVEMRYSSSGRGDRSRQWNWWSDAEQGGGVLGAVASHGIDAVRYLTALEITEVSAMLNTFITSRPFGDGEKTVSSDDFAALQLRLQCGATAAMTFSVVAAVDEPTTLTVHCEAGGVRLRGSELLRADRGASFGPVKVKIDVADDFPGNSNGGPFGTGTCYLGRALRAALAGDSKALAPAATFHDGLAQQRVLDAARRSHQGGGGWTTV